MQNEYICICCRGLGYSMNVPLRNGMTDAAYWALFKPVMARVMQIYQPEAIVFQSGEYAVLTASVCHESKGQRRALALHHITFPGPKIGCLFMQAHAFVFFRWPVHLSHRIFSQSEHHFWNSKIFHRHPATLMVTAGNPPSLNIWEGSQSFMNTMTDYLD